MWNLNLFGAKGNNNPSSTDSNTITDPSSANYIFGAKNNVSPLPADYYQIHRRVKNPIIFNKDFFLAEYKSLRDEILQRISQQTTVLQIAITAWAAILAFALKSEKADTIDLTNDPSIYKLVLLILLYPFLAHFISYAWIWNNIRVSQLGRYLRKREKRAAKVCDVLFWESYIKKRDAKHPAYFLFRGGKIKPGLAIFPGTQIIAIIIAAIVQSETHWKGKNLTIIATVFLATIIITVFTTFKIWGSETAQSS
ncbi:hypothetical protein [Hymenobacter volaticus]|uniref:Uncharacterized protein n=1 Tax=Hymenobacter volaticus TaxID=2932254 RepID=A0ABY4GDR0_9BACT|nr:hypothetical protein [Hymenobacter volaticus]UOQ69042.1 hypothetical protein MUN86_26430 [Hymenobacter volaticus]